MTKTKKKPQAGLSISAMADHHSVDRATMSKAIRKAGITPVSHDHVGHPRYDLEDATEALYDSLPPLPPMTPGEIQQSLAALSSNLLQALEHMAMHGGGVEQAIMAVLERRL
jgi:hypothetical protein